VAASLAMMKPPLHFKDALIINKIVAGAKNCRPGELLDSGCYLATWQLPKDLRSCQPPPPILKSSARSKCLGMQIFGPLPQTRSARRRNALTNSVSNSEKSLNNFPHLHLTPA